MKMEFGAYTINSGDVTRGLVVVASQGASQVSEFGRYVVSVSSSLKACVCSGVGSLLKSVRGSFGVSLVRRKVGLPLAELNNNARFMIGSMESCVSCLALALWAYCRETEGAAVGEEMRHLYGLLKGAEGVPGAYLKVVEKVAVEAGRRVGTGPDSEERAHLSACLGILHSVCIRLSSVDHRFNRSTVRDDVFQGLLSIREGTRRYEDASL